MRLKAITHAAGNMCRRHACRRHAGQRWHAEASSSSRIVRCKWAKPAPRHAGKQRRPRACQRDAGHAHEQRLGGCGGARVGPGVQADVHRAVRAQVLRVARRERQQVAALRRQPGRLQLGRVVQARAAACDTCCCALAALSLLGRMLQARAAHAAAFSANPAAVSFYSAAVRCTCSSIPSIFRRHVCPECSCELCMRAIPLQVGHLSLESTRPGRLHACTPAIPRMHGSYLHSPHGEHMARSVGGMRSCMLGGSHEPGGAPGAGEGLGLEQQARRGRGAEDARPGAHDAARDLR